MASLNTTTSIVASDLAEKGGRQLIYSNMDINQSSLNQQNRGSADGPVAILWDIENCPVPSDVRPEDVASNIRMALQVHPVIKGAVILFSAYGDFNAFPRRVREGCQRTGVKLIDVPNGRKDAADKAILVDMFLFALDNRPPSSIMLISGDVDFAPALHILGQRGYTVVLVIPSGVGVSSALCNAGKFVWDWPSVARGEGFVPPMKFLVPPHAGPADVAGYFVGCHAHDNVEALDDEAIVYRGISQSYYKSRDFSIVSQSLSEYTGNVNMPSFPGTWRTQSLPPGLSETSQGAVSCADRIDSTMWVQPGDINGLRLQLIKLLEMFGGCLPLTRVPSEYQKLFGRPLYVSEYGAYKLVNLFKKMGDAMDIVGKGQKKFVYLRNWKAGPSMTPIILQRKDKKVKGPQEEGLNIPTSAGSSESFSDDERVVLEEHDDGRNQERTSSTGMEHQLEIDDPCLNEFKLELQEILVSYYCRIFLDCFEAIYKQRYKRPLDCQKFGVDQLEELFDKVRDVVVMDEDPVNKRKFISAVGN